jgi:hypothetical protein
VTGALALAAPAGRMTAAAVLAGEDDKSGPIGLAVILVLCILSYLLFKSMSRHLRKVREEFPGDGPAQPAGSDAGGSTPAATSPTARAVTEEDPPAEQGPAESQ